MIVAPPHIQRFTTQPLVAHLDPAMELAMAYAFEFVVTASVGGMYVVRRPVLPLPPLPAHGRLPYVHPAVRAQRAWYDDVMHQSVLDTALALPLTRVHVLAAYLADGWTPTLYEHAVEISGRMQDDGVDPLTADRRAVGHVRRAATVPRVCATCRHYWQLQPRAAFGACQQHHTTVHPEDAAPTCYRQAPTLDVVNAARAYLPPAPVPPALHRAAYPYAPTPEPAP